MKLDLPWEMDIGRASKSVAMFFGLSPRYARKLAEARCRIDGEWTNIADVVNELRDELAPTMRAQRIMWRDAERAGVMSLDPEPAPIAVEPSPSTARDEPDEYEHSLSMAWPRAPYRDDPPKWTDEVRDVLWMTACGFPMRLK